MGTEIRKLTRTDFDQFYPLFEQLIKNEVPQLIQHHKFFLEGDFSRMNIMSALSYSKITIFGYFMSSENVESQLQPQSQLVGFIWGSSGYAGLGFISWLMVRNSFRDNGIAGKLLDAYEKFIKDIGGHVIELYCFEELKDFYVKKGYDVIGVRPKGYFGLKQYILDKLL